MAESDHLRHFGRTMTMVMQTTFGGPDEPDPQQRGDCFPACVASLLGLESADGIPRWYGADSLGDQEANWWAVVDWLRERFQVVILSDTFYEFSQPGDVVEIGHGPHIDPGLRHGDDDIGVAEAERGQHLDSGIGIRDLLAHQILAGDAEMGGARGELRDDLGGREKGDLRPLDAGDGATIVTLAARLDEFQPSAAEEGGRVLLQPALGGHGENQRGVVGG